ncbi:MAG: hypothetical protein HRT58_11145 [Crocinitomicaceae bacterium]|nr:DUF1801 domain-containing protein [Flavobacteriales bacterium]NQZ36212.1 hypothetical protein [Crocinitomicaceae bacterium]PHR35463.1 MAG: hypothetical protein COA38_02055 [Fluviicola sp.]
MNLESVIEKRGEHCAEELRFTRNLILSSHLGINESIKYGLPFFSLKRIMAYMDVQKGKPIVAFMNGTKFGELSKELDFTGRKRVGHFSLANLNEKRHEILCALIDVAIEYDLGNH